MGLTIARVGGTPVLGNKRAIFADITFDSSYPTGGEPLAAADLGLNAIELLLPANAAGYHFAYDPTNAKLKAFAETLQPVADEAVVVTANAGSLAHVPAGTPILYASAGTYTGPLAIVPSGVSPGAGQVALNMATGALATRSADAITAIRAWYLQAPSVAEVPNTTDLHLVTTRVLAIGY